MRLISRVIDLRPGKSAWDIASDQTDDSIATPSGERLQAVSLPEGLNFADLLKTSDQVWAGIAVSFPPDLFSTLREATRLADSRVVQIHVPPRSCRLPRYRNFPKACWLEVLWLNSDALQLVPAAISGISWFATAESAEDAIPALAAVALEDLASIIKDTGEHLSIRDLTTNASLRL